MPMLNAMPAPALTAQALQVGDILIHHAHPGEAWAERAFHCSIVGGTPGNRVLFDSLPGDGVRSKMLSQLNDQCAVFRPRAPAVGLEDAVANRARMMRNANTGYSDAGPMRAIGSIFATHKYTKESGKRLAKYHGRANGSPKNVFCSELVILCYQLGCLDLNLHLGSTHFPNRDGKFTTPWDLEDYLDRHHNDWELVGGI